MVANLENQLKELAGREKNLKDKVAASERVPVPAVEHFISEFGPRVIVSTLIAITLKLVFGI